jgi:hypothetical protein
MAFPPEITCKLFPFATHMAEIYRHNCHNEHYFDLCTAEFVWQKHSLP